MPLSPHSARFVAVLGALAALPPLSIDISLPTLPAVAVAFDAPPGDVGAALSAFLLGFAAGQLLHGAASDRIGRRPVLLVGLAIYVAAGVACAIAPSLPVLIAMRLLQGLGACAGIVIARAMVRDTCAPHQAAATQSVLSSISTLAMLLAPVLGGVVLPVCGFRGVYAVLPLAGAGLLAVCAIGLPETRRAPGPERRAGTGYGRVLREPRVIGAAAINALVFGGMFAYISASPHLLLGGFGVSTRAFGLFFAITALAALAGSSLNRVLLRRFRPDRLTRAGFAVIVVAVLGLGVAAISVPQLGLLVGAMAAYTFACGIIMPSSIALAMAPLPDAAGATAAVVGCAQFAAGALAAALVGVLPATIGGLTIVVAGFALAALILATGLEASSRRHQHQPSPHGSLHGAPDSFVAGPAPASPGFLLAEG